MSDDELLYFRNNLVKFPSGSVGQIIDDPLEDLLNEFAHLEDDSESEANETCQLVDRYDEVRSNDFDDINMNDLADLVLEQLDIMDEVHKRMSYLLTEMESYILP